MAFDPDGRPARKINDNNGTFNSRNKRFVTRQNLDSSPQFVRMALRIFSPKGTTIVWDEDHLTFAASLKTILDETNQ